jgi:hypothetical protein
MNLKDELLALLAGTRIIRIDVKGDLKYAASNMNRLLRAVDENEDFYNVDNYANNTPNKMVKTYQQMQEEAFRIQKDMFITIKDLQLLDLSEDSIVEILKENKESIKFKFRLNEDFVYPQDELENVKDSYYDKRFFEKGSEYDPGKFDYKLDKKGNILKDSNGNPIREEGFIKESLRKLTPIIKDKIEGFKNDYLSEIQTPRLPDTPTPKVQMAQAKDPRTNLTRTESALLSPSEQIIASRT